MPSSSLTSVHKDVLIRIVVLNLKSPCVMLILAVYVSKDELTANNKNQKRSLSVASLKPVYIII